MLSVKAIYDGKELKLGQKISINTPHEVIVTFLDEPSEELTSLEMYHIAMEGKSFDFLHNDEEDIYSDDDLKVKY